MENLHKRAIAIGVLMLIGFFVLYISFGKGAFATEFKKGIAFSLEEDFKIKESLGQVFFMDSSEDIAASGSVSITKLIAPADCEMRAEAVFGETVIVLDCNEFSELMAVADGVIEVCEKDRFTLRHNDGKLSVYSGATGLYRIGDRVKQGTVIGYTNGEAYYKLYENCIAVNPFEYMSR